MKILTSFTYLLALIVVSHLMRGYLENVFSQFFSWITPLDIVLIPETHLVSEVSGVQIGVSIYEKTIQKIFIAVILAFITKSQKGDSVKEWIKNKVNELIENQSTFVHWCLIGFYSVGALLWLGYFGVVGVLSMKVNQLFVWIPYIILSYLSTLESCKKTVDSVIHKSLITACTVFLGFTLLQTIIRM
jgi:hypothetical protein